MNKIDKVAAIFDKFRHFPSKEELMTVKYYWSQILAQAQLMLGRTSRLISAQCLSYFTYTKMQSRPKKNLKFESNVRQNMTTQVCELIATFK